MHFVSTRIQKGYLRRIGIRGRWLTAYMHRYGGRQESSERFHQHPWRWAISIILWGWFWDEKESRPDPPFSRRMGSVAIYPMTMRHRVRRAHPGTISLFIGINRTQIAMSNAQEKCSEGYCHYTELSGNIDEPQLH